jgi:predicted enzyme involved in methoxymalonyl-ACP biosynthesis
MGREVEKSILGHIINKAVQSGVKRIRAQFIPSKKNKPAEDFLPNCGFKKEGEFWIYRLDSQFKIPEYIAVSVQ